ncbi:hypothetical protein PVAND_004746 [Polypedilum vanderplanki]|uniref:Uncharacterized protein n=1 Tax=Polypedilum vanderplanki TaxID=319348 RepID=A0A9J6C017_POLVA|nr:hypothetical protein PVAND_004746 [Polypedilum vanderplanki]
MHQKLFKEQIKSNNYKSEKFQKELLNDKLLVLRKISTSTANKINVPTLTSQLRNAHLTESKIGLTLTIREENFLLLLSILKINIEKISLLESSDLNSIANTNKDLEDIAVDLEFKCFNSCKSVSIYKRNISIEKKSKEIETIDSNKIEISTIDCSYISQLKLKQFALEEELRQIKKEREEMNLKMNQKKRKSDSEINSRLTKLPRIEENSKDVLSKYVPSAIKVQQNKRQISSVVIDTLSQFYFDNRIQGNDPKALFKAIAKKITYYFQDSNPKIVKDQNIVDYIYEVFYQAQDEIVTNLEDF